MSGHDDYTAERFQSYMDDELIEAILTGRAVGPDLAPLTAFVKDVRTVASGPLPVPSRRMTAILAEGFSTDKGDLLATAASNANGPGAQESGLSKWRRLKMFIAKFIAGLGLTAKVGLSVGVAAASVFAFGQLRLWHPAGSQVPARHAEPPPGPQACCRVRHSTRYPASSTS